jgi:WD40 repeat protein
VAPTEANRDVLLTVDVTARRERIATSSSSGTRFTKLDGGRLFATSEGYDLTTQLWDLRSHGADQYRGMMTGRPVIVSDDDRRAIVGTGRGAELQDITNPSSPRKLSDAPSSFFDENELSANGAVDTFASIAVTGLGRDDRAVKVWRYVGSGELREIVLPVTKPVALRMSLDGRTLAVSRSDPGSVEIWRLDGDTAHRMSESVTQTLWHPTRFSPDGRFLLLTNSAEGEVQVWDVADPANPVVQADIPTQPRAKPMIEFSPDGRRVLLGTDRAVSLWDLEQRGKPVRVARFENFPDNITAVDHWSPPYGFVAVTEINIWPLRTDADEVIRNLCLGDVELSDSDWARYFPDVERKPVC